MWTLKYFATVDNREFEVDISDRNDFTMDGVLRQVELLSVGSQGLYSLLFEGLSHDVFVEQVGQGFVATIAGVKYTVQIEDEKVRLIRCRMKSEESESRNVEVRAPMPGLVVKINASEGEEIAKGFPLLIVEAMKMENEIRAGTAGIVRKISVSENDSVEKGALLMVLE